MIKEIMIKIMTKHTIMKGHHITKENSKIKRNNEPVKYSEDN